MPLEPILKQQSSWKVVPNLRNYEQMCAAFSWQQAQQELDGLPAGRGLNIAHEAIDRHALSPRKQPLALRLPGKFALAGCLPELYLAALGTFKNRSVFCPLFSAFGSEPIKARINLGAAKILVTTETPYQRKVAAIRGCVACSSHRNWAYQPAIHQLWKIHKTLQKGGGL